MPISAGGIIVRQRGSKVKAGLNVGMGKDHTLFAKAGGVVKFHNHEYKENRMVVSVLSAWGGFFREFWWNPNIWYKRIVHVHMKNYKTYGAL